MGAGGFVGALEFCGETVLGLDICVFSYSQNLPVRGHAGLAAIEWRLDGE